MICKLSSEPVTDSLLKEQIDTTCIEELAGAMLNAYIDTIDYEGESYEDTLKEIINVINGGYGGFIPEASYMIREDGKIAAAILINNYINMPLITYVFTSKEFWGRGMTSSLINSSKQALLEMGYKNLQLFVTVGNKTALGIYTKAGFFEMD